MLTHEVKYHYDHSSKLFKRRTFSSTFFSNLTENITARYNFLILHSISISSCSKEQLYNSVFNFIENLMDTV